MSDDPVLDWSITVQRAYVAGSLGAKRYTPNDFDTQMLDALLDVRRTQGRKRYYELVWEIRNGAKDNAMRLREAAE